MNLIAIAISIFRPKSPLRQRLLEEAQAQISADQLVRCRCRFRDDDLLCICTTLDPVDAPVCQLCADDFHVITR